MAAFWIIVGLLALRAIGEWSMMRAVGSDPQMGIWIMFMWTKMLLWAGCAALIGGLFAFSSRRGLITFAIGLLIAWGGLITKATWDYGRAAKALVDAADLSTPAARLRELAHFDGVQAGHELDNRLASNPNTPPETLRELHGRGQLGTDMLLGRNPNTPKDILPTLMKP